MIDYRRLAAGALSGAVAALVVDVHAWSRAKKPGFDWGLALKRWVAGAVSGAAAALGVGGLQ